MAPQALECSQECLTRGCTSMGVEEPAVRDLAGLWVQLDEMNPTSVAVYSRISDTADIHIEPLPLRIGVAFAFKLHVAPFFRAIGSVKQVHQGNIVSILRQRPVLVHPLAPSFPFVCSGDSVEIRRQTGRKRIDGP